MANSTRLKRLKEKENRKMTKTASVQMFLDSFVLDSGDVIELSVRFVNNKPWFQILHEHSWESSSFYDGPDHKRAFQIYADLLTSFKNISLAEKFVKSIPNHINKIEDVIGNESTKLKFEEYHNLIQKSPKFLGINNF